MSDPRAVTTTLLLADLPLSYPDLDRLDGAVELKFCGADESITAWPLLHEASVFVTTSIPAAEASVLGGRAIRVPPSGIESRRDPAEEMALETTSWWSGLQSDFFAATRCPPPARQLFFEGSCRVFVLPVEGGK
jgi:hypothetical protein